MFFGAGNALFPVMLGEAAGAATPAALLGFFIGGIVIPFLGLVAMMLYKGDYRLFFGRMGPKVGFGLFTGLILLLGPIGSIPRLITISFATLYPYLGGVDLFLYSCIACLSIFLFVLWRSQVLSILSYLLTPLLLLSLMALVFHGYFSDLPLGVGRWNNWEALFHGLEKGYSLLDLIACFLYATVVLNHLQKGCSPGAKGQRELIVKTCTAGGIAALLLTLFYIGLAQVGAKFGVLLPVGTPAEELLRLVSYEMLGSVGGIVASLAVGLACLTTAISLVVVCSQFLEKEWFKGRVSPFVAPIATLLLSLIISNLGFSGISALIEPILNVLHPPLILLCVLNILYHLFEVRSVRFPVFTTFLMSCSTYFI